MSSTRRQQPLNIDQKVFRGEGLFGDPVLNELYQRFGKAPYSPHRVKKEEPFRTLLASIVGQQLSVKAADKIWERLETKFEISPQVILEADGNDLRALGFSWGKVKYAQDLSKFALEGKLKNIQKKDDEEIVETLVQVKGIGIWSAQMYLMFGLGRPDVWPLLDLGVRQGITLHFGIEDKKEMEILGERFRPHRSHLAWYMWRVVHESRKKPLSI